MTTDTMQTVEGKVTVSTVEGTGIITLNRPRALNAIDQEMVDVMSPGLHDWADDPAIAQVLIRSTSPKAFCSGGDVRYGYTQMIEGATDRAEHFFLSSYAMYNRIATFPKPYIALINGLAMGGGLGVSVNGSYRIVTENASAAMPEGAIGYVPDVGMTYAMQRMTGLKGYASPALATFIGTTGWRLTAADMLWSGLATQHVPASEVEFFEKAVLNSSIEEALDTFAQPLDAESELSRFESAIEDCFGEADWHAIEARLERHPNTEFTKAVKKHLTRANPASVVAAVEVFRAGATSTREALNNEYTVGKTLREEPNFPEGIQAVLIEKGREPQFSPARPSEVDPTRYRRLLTRVESH